MKNSLQFGIMHTLPFLSGRCPMQQGGGFYVSPAYGFRTSHLPWRREFRDDSSWGCKACLMCSQNRCSVAPSGATLPKTIPVLPFARWHSRLLDQCPNLSLSLPSSQALQKSVRRQLYSSRRGGASPLSNPSALRLTSLLAAARSQKAAVERDPASSPGAAHRMVRRSHPGPSSAGKRQTAQWRSA
jgi:hypothetical protein